MVAYYLKLQLLTSEEEADLEKIILVEMRVTKVYVQGERYSAQRTVFLVRGSQARHSLLSLNRIGVQ